MFNSNLYNRKKQFHLYSTNDYALESIGMNTYTLSSLSGYMNTNNPDVKKFFNSNTTGDGSVSNVTTAQNKLTAKTTPDIQDITILKWNKEKLKYEEVIGSNIFKTKAGNQAANDILDLLQKHDYLQIGDSKKVTNSGDVLEVINNIRTSLSGCISFATTFNVLGTQRSGIFKIEFLDRFHHDTSRRLASAGPPLIAAIPSTADGMPYSLRGTQNAPIGIYQNPAEGGIKNPNNTVAAPLRLSYDPSSCTWEAGTQQVLARLLTDVDSAGVTTFAAYENLDNISYQQFYDTESTNYFGQFTTGQAMPLSVENGNPHMCGPNLVGCEDNTKVKKILVVNRSPRSFKKGDVVLCSRINNEWILQGFDTPQISTTPLVKIGKWSFSKFIVTSDGYLKDKNFATTNGQSYIENINPSIYETKIRKMYYMHMHDQPNDGASQVALSPIKLLDQSIRRKTALLNMHIALNEKEALSSPILPSSEYHFLLSDDYIQSTIFDNVGTHMGGKNDKNFIGRTNISESPSVTTVSTSLLQSELPFFWGPLFPDGYSSSQVTNLKVNTVSFKAKPDKTFLEDGTSNTTSNVFSNSHDNNHIWPSSNRMFSNIDDGNAKQLPAEIALNSSRIANSKYGSPIENTSIFATGLSIKNNLVDLFYNQLKSDYRYHYLEGSGNIRTNSLYDLTPISPHIIQFSPLQLQAALSSVKINDPFPSTLLQLYRNIAKAWRKFDSNDGPSNPIYQSIASKMFDPTFNRSNKQTVVFPENAGANILGTTRIYFGPYTKAQGFPPLGGPDIIPKSSDGYERSNIIGIIASKNKFIAPSNGVIKLTTKQTIGIADRFGGGGGGTTVLSSLFAYGGIVGISNSSSSTFTTPQWGDSTGTERNFGTTALHVRIFDQWPDDQTFYDGRYFSVLHFNPFVNSGIQPRHTDGSDVGYRIVDAGKVYTDTWDYTKTNVEYERKVDIEETSVDFRVPTYMHPTETATDNTLVPLATVIDSGGAKINNTIKALRPYGEWKVDTIRRGQLLTGGGFRYYKRTIGANEWEIKNSGLNYVVGDIIKFPLNAEAKVESVDSAGKISNISILDSGYGFLPTNFYGGVFSNKTDSANGVGASIVIKNGKVYDKLEHDLGPQETSTIRRLSLPSTTESKSALINLSNEVSISLTGNGKYDAFYVFHNDILHTLWDTSYSLGPAQYVRLEIGAG
jgi:hypothetical protein